LRLKISWTSGNVFVNTVIVSDCIPVPQNNLDFNLLNWNNAGLSSRPTDLIASDAVLPKNIREIRLIRAIRVKNDF
jgi:hypothetical protein